MDFDTFFDVAMEHLQSVTRTETVIGEPFEVGGQRFVPITEIRLGIGAAGGEGRAEVAKTGGGGLVGGFRVSPVAVVCLADDVVTVLPVKQAKGTIERVLDLVPEILAKLKDASATAQEIGKQASATVRGVRDAVAPPKDG